MYFMVCVNNFLCKLSIQIFRTGQCLGMATLFYRLAKGVRILLRIKRSQYGFVIDVYRSIDHL